MSTAEIGGYTVERNDEARSVTIVTSGGVDPVLSREDAWELYDFAAYGPAADESADESESSDEAEAPADEPETPSEPQEPTEPSEPEE